MNARVVELREIIENGYIPTKFKVRERWDKSANKWRTIYEPKLWPDQYIHHALVQVLEPVMMRGMDRYCCGSIRGRGIHYGMKSIKRWMKEDVKGTKYCLSLDIHHFYDSIRSEIVVNRFRDLIKDRKVLDLIGRITEDGVKIGLYCSQWFANTILQPLDHEIREGGYNISHYLRYMDNFTIFSSNKRSLRKLLGVIKAHLVEIGLSIKDDWQIFCTDNRLPDALGYRFGRGFTLLRKKNLFRLKRQLNRFYKKMRNNQKVPLSMAAGLLSRFGQLKHCNCAWFFCRYYHDKTQRILKNIVRSKTARIIYL